MVGQHNYFFALAKADIESVVLMKCTCHSATLIATKACSKLPKHPEDLVRQIYNYISGSAQRSAQLFEMQEFFRMERKKILRLASTRWLSLRQRTVRVLGNWEVVEGFFTTCVYEDNLLVTENILTSLKDHCVKTYLLFLEYILQDIIKFNILFQSDKILIQEGKYLRGK